MSGKTNWRNLNRQEIGEAYEAEDENGNPCVVLKFPWVFSGLKVMSDADISGGGDRPYVVVPKLPKLEWVSDMDKIKRVKKKRGGEMSDQGFASEEEDDFDGWCEECNDDDGDVKLDSGEWLCRDCLAKRCNELMAADSPPAWTKEQPTEPGWYFVRRKDDRTKKSCDYYDAEDLNVSPTFYSDWEWAGPYPEPVKPDE